MSTATAIAEKPGQQEHLTPRTIIMNVGPQHPATHGTLRQVLELDGEIIRKCTPELGFLHTGFEKLAEYMTFNQFVTVTDRMNYLSALSNNIGWVTAVEEALGIEITERCKWARMTLCEMARIADHVASVGLQAMDLGAFSVMLWAWIQREKLYDLFELTTGIRLTNGFARVGGLMWDVPEDLSPRLKKFLDEFPETLKNIEKMLDRNRIFLDRCIGIGVIPKEELLSYGVTGPVLRAAGVNYDVRRAEPYFNYDKVDFEVPVQKDGDVYARYRQRMGELRASATILRQCIEKLPPGPINVDDHKHTLPPKGKEGKFKNRPTNMEDLIMHFKQIMDSNKMGHHGYEMPVGQEYYSATEAPNGELGWHIIMRGDGRPYRVRVRPPSLINYQALPAMVEGGLLSDLVANLASLHVIAGELDR